MIVFDPLIGPGAYPRVEHLKGASLGKYLALPTNIRLGWKGLPVRSTLGYYDNLQIMAVKISIVQAPGV